MYRLNEAAPADEIRFGVLTVSGREVQIEANLSEGSRALERRIRATIGLPSTGTRMVLLDRENEITLAQFVARRCVGYPTALFLETNAMSENFYISPIKGPCCLY